MIHVTILVPCINHFFLGSINHCRNLWLECSFDLSVYIRALNKFNKIGQFIVCVIVFILQVEQWYNQQNTLYIITYISDNYNMGDNINRMSH